MEPTAEVVHQGREDQAEMEAKRTANSRASTTAIPFSTSLPVPAHPLVLPFSPRTLRCFPQHPHESASATMHPCPPCGHSPRPNLPRRLPLSPCCLRERERSWEQGCQTQPKEGEFEHIRSPPRGATRKPMPFSIAMINRNITMNSIHYFDHFFSELEIK